MADIIVITGAPGAGKSTVARALAERFDPSFHLEVDGLRENMVNGFIMPEQPFSRALEQQFAMVRRTATFMARDYADSGVTFVVDDAPIPDEFGEHYAVLFDDDRVTRIMLRPDDDSVISRLRGRGGPFDEVLIEIGPERFGEALDKVPTEGWHVIDSSDLSVGETVDAIAALLTAR